MASDGTSPERLHQGGMRDLMAIERRQIQFLINISIGPSFSDVTFTEHLTDFDQGTITSQNSRLILQE